MVNRKEGGPDRRVSRIAHIPGRPPGPQRREKTKGNSSIEGRHTPMEAGLPLAGYQSAICADNSSNDWLSSTG